MHKVEISDMCLNLMMMKKKVWMDCLRGKYRFITLFSYQKVIDNRKEPLDIFRVLPSGFGNVTILLFPNPIEGSINVTKVLKWVFLENPTFDLSFIAYVPR